MAKQWWSNPGRFPNSGRQFWSVPKFRPPVLVGPPNSSVCYPPSSSFIQIYSNCSFEASDLFFEPSLSLIVPDLQPKILVKYIYFGEDILVVLNSVIWIPHGRLFRPPMVPTSKKFPILGYLLDWLYNCLIKLI